MSDEFDERLKAIERLVRVFRWERYTYLVVSVLALLMLLSSGTVLIVRTKADPATLTLLFGSAGLITYSIGRLLRMWDQAITFLQKEVDAAKEGSDG